ncbi:hypothetical protein DSM104299_04450 [Baekduia alba]|nr:hypothetical protein DSM104299_04450 [Baekduia alba]
MLRRLVNRLTYANVVATLALFIALGGSSYAAIKLPKNSVGTTQIKTDAVHTGEIRDRTIRLQDISTSARTSLRGQAGPAGPQGPSGAPAVKHFAAVTAGGGFVRGDAKSGGRDTAVGTYVVGFSESVSGCAYSATLGTTDASSAPAGRVTVNDHAGSAGVQTYDAAGNPADLPFHLIVAC